MLNSFAQAVKARGEAAKVRHWGRRAAKPMNTTMTSAPSHPFRSRRASAGKVCRLSRGMLGLAVMVCLVFSPSAFGQTSWQMLEASDPAAWASPRSADISLEEADDPAGQGKCIALYATGVASGEKGPAEHPSTGLKIPPIEVGQTATLTFLIQVSDAAQFNMRCGLASAPPNAATVRHHFRMFRGEGAGKKVSLLTHAGDLAEDKAGKFFELEPGLWYRVWLVSTNEPGADATCKIQIMDTDGAAAPELFDTLNLATSSGDKTLDFLGFVFNKDQVIDAAKIYLKDVFWSEGENLTVPKS